MNTRDIIFKIIQNDAEMELKALKIILDSFDNFKKRMELLNVFLDFAYGNVQVFVLLSRFNSRILKYPMLHYDWLKTIVKHSRLKNESQQAWQFYMEIQKIVADEDAFVDILINCPFQSVRENLLGFLINSNILISIEKSSFYALKKSLKTVDRLKTRLISAYIYHQESQDWLLDRVLELKNCSFDNLINWHGNTEALCGIILHCKLKDSLIIKEISDLLFVCCREGIKSLQQESCVNDSTTTIVWRIVTLISKTLVVLQEYMALYIDDYHDWCVATCELYQSIINVKHWGLSSQSSHDFQKFCLNIPHSVKINVLRQTMCKETSVVRIDERYIGRGRIILAILKGMSKEEISQHVKNCIDSEIKIIYDEQIGMKSNAVMTVGLLIGDATTSKFIDVPTFFENMLYSQYFARDSGSSYLFSVCLTRISDSEFLLSLSEKILSNKDRASRILLAALLIVQKYCNKADVGFANRFLPYLVYHGTILHDGYLRRLVADITGKLARLDVKLFFELMKAKVPSIDLNSLHFFCSSLRYAKLSAQDNKEQCKILLNLCRFDPLIAQNRSVKETLDAVLQGIESPTLLQSMKHLLCDDKLCYRYLECLIMHNVVLEHPEQNFDRLCDIIKLTKSNWRKILVLERMAMELCQFKFNSNQLDKWLDLVRMCYSKEMHEEYQKYCSHAKGFQLDLEMLKKFCKLVMDLDLVQILEFLVQGHFPIKRKFLEVQCSRIIDGQLIPRRNLNTFYIDPVECLDLDQRFDTREIIDDINLRTD